MGHSEWQGGRRGLSARGRGLCRLFYGGARHFKSCQLQLRRAGSQFAAFLFLILLFSGFCAQPLWAGEVQPVFASLEETLWRPINGMATRQEQWIKRRGGNAPLVELFSGSDVTENQYGFYAGGVTGALGPHLALKGLRLRAAYGRGSYKYRSSRQVGAVKVPTLFLGTSEFYEAMVGYETRFQGAIFKFYGGVVVEENHIDPLDVDNQLEGQKVGGKMLVEAWRDLPGGHWLSAYGAYTTGTDYYTLHGRYGAALNSLLHVGIEGGVFGNREFDALRLGAFGKFKLGDGEFTVSAGVSGDYEQPDSVYGTVQYFTKLYQWER